MRQNIERKGRNPRITVCYTPDENEKIVKLATTCGLKKSQYIHDTSLGQEPKVMMSDKEADALMSLKAARGELVLIKNALHGTTRNSVRSTSATSNLCANGLRVLTALSAD